MECDCDRRQGSRLLLLVSTFRTIAQNAKPGLTPESQYAMRKMQVETINATGRLTVASGSEMIDYMSVPEQS